MAGEVERLLELMYDTREKIRGYDDLKSKEQAIYDQAEYELVQVMQDAGIRSAGIDKCTATLKVEKYPQVQDMEQFATWCVDNGHTEMIQKRISKKPFDEYFEQTNELPDGVDTYDKVSVGIRKR